MSRLLVASMGIIPIMAFSVVAVTGILSGVEIMTLLKRGIIAGGISGFLWGLIAYIFSSNKTTSEHTDENTNERQPITENVENISDDT